MSTAELAVEFKEWTGLNTKDAVGRVKDSELIECLNFNLGSRGELVKRTGFEKIFQGGTLGANSVILLGYFKTDVYSQFIARAGTNLYTSTDGTTWTVISGGPFGNTEHGVQYGNKFYIVRRDSTILQWDGAAMSSIAGSPLGSFCFVHKDRLFVLNTYGTGVLGSRLFFSEVGDFSATGWVSTNFFDFAQGNGDVLTCAVVYQGVVFAFKSLSIWMLYADDPDPINWSIRNSNPEIGCISKYTPKVIEGSLFFLSFDGVYVTDGITYNDLSAPVGNRFRNQLASLSFLNKAAACWWDDKYIIQIQTFSIPLVWNAWTNKTWDELSNQTWDASGAVYYTLVYHLDGKGWTEWSYSITPFNFLEVRQESTNKGLYAGSRAADGKIYKYGKEVYQDDSVDYECSFQTKEFDFGTSLSLKRGKWVGVEQQGDSTTTISNIVNSEELSQQIITAGVNRREYKVKGPGYFRTWRARSVVVSSGPITFYGFGLIMHHKRNVARSGVM